MADERSQTLRRSARLKAKQAGPAGEHSSSFGKFSQLPAELRLSIWRFHWEASKPKHFHPYRVRIYIGRRKVNGDKHSVFTRALKLTPLPELSQATKAQREALHICRDMRYEVLRELPDEMAFHSGGILRFNSLRDMIYLDDLSDEVIPELTSALANGELPAFTSAIKHMGINMVPEFPGRIGISASDQLPPLNFFLCFPALQTISFLSLYNFSGRGWDQKFFEENKDRYKAWYKLGGKDAEYSHKTKVGRTPTSEKHVCTYCVDIRCKNFTYALEHGMPRDPTDEDQDVAELLTGEEREWLKRLVVHRIVPMTSSLAGTLEEFEP